MADAIRTEELRKMEFAYSSAIRAAIEDRGGRFAPLFNVGEDIKAEAERLDTASTGTKLMDTDPGSFEPISLGDITTSARWVFAKPADHATGIDRQRALTLPYDLTNPHISEHAAVVNRTLDQQFIDACFADVKEGTRADVTVPFPSANILPDGGVGMTTNKLEDLRVTLEENDVDLDAYPFTIIIGPKQWKDLMNIPEFRSADYNSAKVMNSGRLVPWMGFNWLMSNRVPKSGNIRHCIALNPQAIQLRYRTRATTTLTVREDLRLKPIQVYTMAEFGFTRVEDKLVYRIDCVE